MTYGVDQCRVCGIEIKPWSNNSIAQYEEAQRKPPIAEAEWRRRGFLALPSKQQLANPTNGCCTDCGQKQLRIKFHPGRRIAYAFSGSVLLCLAVVIILTFMRH